MITHRYCYQFHYKHGFKKNWIVSIHWVISPSPKLYCLWAVEWLKVSFWVFFNITLTVFENFFAAWYEKMFQDCLAHLLCKIQNQSFLQWARFFLVSTAWKQRIIIIISFLCDLPCSVNPLKITMKWIVFPLQEWEIEQGEVVKLAWCHTKCHQCCQVCRWKQPDLIRACAVGLCCLQSGRSFLQRAWCQCLTGTD